MKLFAALSLLLTPLIHAANEPEIATIFYKDYQPPAFFVPDIQLILDVQSDLVLVTTNLAIERNSSSESLVLDGRDQRVLSVSVNGNPCQKDSYKTTQDGLVLFNIPNEESFTVSVVSEIDPFHNRSLSGLYSSGKFLTSQCESEGARKIFFTLDRPDVLSRITTTIIADVKQYPFRLSNGNLISKSFASDGRIAITWEDPIPKPSYLFACVLGDFSRLEDRFTTRSGKEVSLEVYVEPGKEKRATYSLTALKAAMQFDEEFFDREYDLDCLKMVAISDFNFGAMENKGLMIFNDACLLVDSQSGTDANFRQIATIVAHEYFHNWSGNRVTIRNWFELALKEAFTDFRAALFGEWLFGSAFIRPEQVTLLREQQFPEETSGEGHPIIVESYVNASSLYDHTTYIKGREVFRTLQTYMDMMVPGGFREAQNLYFSRYDGQAVTFRELLSAANEILAQHTGKNLDQFERWFDQPGTPQIRVEMKSLAGKIQLTVTQSCPHPVTGDPQKPFLIPFSYEFLRKDGSVAYPRENFILSKASHQFEVPAEEELIPVFMHDYSAPVVLYYEYTQDEIACLMAHAQDPFIQWEMGQNYSLLAIRKSEELFKPYIKALESQMLSPLAKAQLLQLPSLRAISQNQKNYDFVQLQKKRTDFKKRLASASKAQLKQLLIDHPEPLAYAPTSEQMQIRELREAALNLLSAIDPSLAKELYQRITSADNFNTAYAGFRILMNLETLEKEKAISEFYNRWKNDKILFNYWLKAQAASPSATVRDLKRLMSVEGYDAQNPNHIRSLLCTFMNNLGRYHDPKGEGYAFIVDRILEIGPSNPTLAHTNIASMAFIDFEMVPKAQQTLMIREMKRLQSPLAPPATRDMIKKMLGLAQ